MSEVKHYSLIENNLFKFPFDLQVKFKNYRRWQDTQLSLLGYLLLSEGLKKVYDYEISFEDIQRTKYKKPNFRNSSIKFNISHSGQIAVCAFNEKRELGIDIEEIVDIEVEDFKSQMTEIEWYNLKKSENQKFFFFQYWTQKEAVVKAYGQGLGINLNSFEVIDNKTKINEQNFFVKEIFIDKNYKCHIALNDNINCIKVIEVKL